MTDDSTTSAPPQGPITAKKLLQFGEPAPWFSAPCGMNQQFVFDTVAGRAVVLCFFASARLPMSRGVLDAFLERRGEFDDEHALLFGVSVDPEDESLGRIEESLPGIRFFRDYDYSLSRQYGAAPNQPPLTDLAYYRGVSYVLDERLRVVATIPFQDAPRAHVERVLQAAKSLPRLDEAPAAQSLAPVLLVPRVFEPELCRELIEYFERDGGRESGFMRDVQGQTVELFDHVLKRRRDREIEDDRLRTAAMHRIHDRLAPEIRKAFQFHVTRIERHMVARYDGDSGDHFFAHRDNTTLGTAHRRFAVTLNLNTGEYEGGQLHFPEFGRQTYLAPLGGAVVFSCSLLHQALPVTAGKRYAYLPFLYDDEAAKIREANLRFVAE